MIPKYEYIRRGYEHWRADERDFTVNRVKTLIRIPIHLLIHTHKHRYIHIKCGYIYKDIGMRTCLPKHLYIPKRLPTAAQNAGLTLHRAS